ncbi:MAG: fructose-specific PTS transporter subunit EIIC [Eubacteriaceae bacterium]|jgi:PTS system fructose-specific IIC component|nr:fructose-specific PTS transporter subunit EIIC [Eubacteriaceae bacterium]
MRIIDLLKDGSVVTNADVSTKDQAIDMMIGLHDKCGNISDVVKFKEGILKREEESTTAVGEGIAIPHCKSEVVASPGLTALTVPAGIDYNAPDGKDSNILFMIAAPLDGDLHLEVLARLMTLLMDMDLRNKLIAAKDENEFIAAIDEAEKAKYPDEAGSQEVVDAAEAAGEDEGYKILAVTACPTGIAHTYMAAESLEKKAAEMGFKLKAETNGSMGAKNVLTPEEIAAADGIIIAADKNVDMARFAGKRVYSTKVADGINKPEELINQILNKTAPIMEGDVKAAAASGSNNESKGHQVYKHLMNGVSYMLPFVVGGGIMIALAFLIDTIAGAPRDSSFGTFTAAAAFFKSIGGVGFGFMLPVLAGFIAESIADRPGLAVGFVGGSIATLGCTFANVTGDAAAVSGFLGALLAGFVGGYIVKLLRKVFAWLPDSVSQMMPILIIPLFGMILMGLFMCAINPFVGALNTAISNGLNGMGQSSAVILGCIVAGMMAIDMGGPFNKAAYVFGTAALTTGGYNIMAAVMIGGMVPPIAIALCTTIFKNRWTKEERRAGAVNYVMGLCFITEGAIPFAAGDPLRVIPSCIAGSALAGGLSMLFNCTLMAPHGGIFVFAVVGHAPMYVVALIAGSVLAALLLAILKRPLSKEAQEAGASMDGLKLE